MQPNLTNLVNKHEKFQVRLRQAKKNSVFNAKRRKYFGNAEDLTPAGPASSVPSAEDMQTEFRKQLQRILPALLEPVLSQVKTLKYRLTNFLFSKTAFHCVSESSAARWRQRKRSSLCLVSFDASSLASQPTKPSICSSSYRAYQFSCPTLLTVKTQTSLNSMKRLGY